MIDSIVFKLVFKIILVLWHYSLHVQINNLLLQSWHFVQGMLQSGHVVFATLQQYVHLFQYAFTMIL